MDRMSLIVAAAAAIAVGAVGVLKGTYAAGGSDSSCYALMAEAFASGHLQPTSALASEVPWPDATRTFTPGGFVPSERSPNAASPICAPGFSLLLAPAVAIAGVDSLFWITPLAGALLVWMGFLAGRALSGPVAGAMAAVLIAVSPPVLYQVVQPMNDVTTAALWMATFVALVERRWTLAGISCGLALLVRPNLLPLAIVAAVFAAATQGNTRRIRDWGLGIRSVGKFVVGVIPFAVLVLLLNQWLYGSPFRTGYGQLENLFSFSVVAANAARYLGWLIDTHTPFPLLAFAAPFGVAKERRPDAILALVLIAATCVIYFLYTPFDDWSYLRFLLPAITVMLVLASIVTVQFVARLADHGPAKGGHYVLVGGITAVLAVFCVRAATERHVFALQFLEQRYRSAGKVVRDHLPPAAVVLSVWDSGAVRFHGRREALSWEALDPGWLDRSLQWLESRGHRPYILVESWEEPGFRRRFSQHSNVGKLDWPPNYEIDRVVRIFDPRDRERYHRGERVDTEFVWPLRD
jgi:Dolichyl-phosphate-mannose-protein mannosyltransferase